jgi:hypothetical protein
VSRVDPAKPPVNRKVENPPAFPRTGSWPPDLKQTHTEDLGIALATSTEPQAGMTLRDYFAAHALTGIVASPDCYRARLKAAEMAQGAYNVADEMLAIRDKREPSPLPPDFTDNDHDGMG